MLFCKLNNDNFNFYTSKILKQKLIFNNKFNYFSFLIHLCFKSCLASRVLKNKLDMFYTII
jgi:hypothetical protein